MAEESTTADYIVVGAGSAGSIVAGNLSARPDLSVLLLEAGGAAESWPQIWEPKQINCLYGIPEIHWGYKTTPQQHLAGRVLDCWRAKVSGGCTAHNDMVYTRGAPADFDQWEEIYGCSGWRFGRVARNFERVEAILRPSTTERNDFGGDYVAACEALGFPFNPNYNSGGNMFGVSPLQSTIGGGRRVTSFERYVAPYVGRRPNLEVALGAQAARIVWTGNRATGVSYVQGGVTRNARAVREVVLAGGSINNPQLLLCSGVGPADQLQALGCERVVADLPGVGRNLQNVLIFMGTWSTRRPIATQAANLGYAIVWADVNLSGQAAICAEMTRGIYGCDEPAPQDFYSITGDMMRLESRGAVTLRSLDPFDKPIIDMNFLADPGDYDQCLAGFELMRRIGNSAGLASWRDEECVPGPGVRTPEEIRRWILTNATSMSHPAGTCAMGRGELAVADPELRVYGVEGLRVADVSIMPRITSGHTQGPAFMIGDRASELILAGA